MDRKELAELFRQEATHRRVDENHFAEDDEPVLADIAFLLANSLDRIADALDPHDE